MTERELTCINCPLGCSLKVTIDDDNNIKVQGNSCKRGELYGIKECTNPTRIVTSTVFIKNGEERVVSVKTDKDIPKDKIFDCIKALKNIEAEAPINIGDIIISNVLGLEADIIATKSIDVKR